MENLENYIAGELRAPSFGRYLDNFEPATGRVYSQVPSIDSADLEDAVAAAKNAAAVWAKAPSDERARIMHRIADGIEARAEELAQAESRDNGKPVSLARALDIPRSSANMRFFASAATQFFSESHAMESAPSTTPSGSPSESWGPSLHGICRFTCSHGESRRRSPPATLSSPSPLSSHR